MIDTILSQLICNQEYFGKVWPYLKGEYFDTPPTRLLYDSIRKHVNDYNGVPSKVALDIAISNSTVDANTLKGSKDFLNSLKDQPEKCEWLVPETERFVKMKAVSIATIQLIKIHKNSQLPIDKQDKKLPDVGSIPDIMRDAVSISFDTEIGHSWIDDYEARWLSYKNKTSKIPFRMPCLNKITKGGAENATLNLLLAGSNVGKSLGLCSLAADYMQVGKNVLYISMEMSEFVCAKRIDANLIDVTLDDIDDDKITYEEYKTKMDVWRANNSLGELRIKQYGTGCANADTFRNLINELKLKKGFVADVIIIDYLGICGSSRIKTYTENSYTLVKSIAEELRALAFETNTCLWSAAQTTRAAWDASDIAMSDVAESAGLIFTCDFILAVIETEEMALQGVQLLKQIKSRYGDKMKYNKIQIGVKKGNQRWIDLDSDQERGAYKYEQPKSLEEPKVAGSAKLQMPTEQPKPLSNSSVPGRSELEEFAATINWN